MAIRLTPAVSVSRTKEYLATKRTVKAIKKAVVLGSDCCFCVSNCNWDLPVFALLTDENDRERNDRNDFIIQVPEGATVTGTLIQLNPDNSVKQSIPIVDSTYGNFYSTGTVKANVWAFIIDWYKVADIEGFGRWKFNITVENGASTEIFNQDSACFWLRPWTCEDAHRTVKIKTEQSGYFEGGFDYTGLDFLLALPGKIKISNSWPQEIRLWGRFWRSGFPEERDVVATQQRGRQLVQSKIWQSYTLKLDTIPTSVSNRLVLDMFQAPQVFISDFNISNIDVYRSVRVNLTDIAEPINFTQNINEFLEFTFEDWQQDNVHRFR